jgi:hypothetical protein
MFSDFLVCFFKIKKVTLMKDVVKIPKYRNTIFSPYSTKTKNKAYVHFSVLSNVGTVTFSVFSRGKLLGTLTRRAHRVQHSVVFWFHSLSINFVGRRRTVVVSSLWPLLRCDYTKIFKSFDWFPEYLIYSFGSSSNASPSMKITKSIC